jgi:hypothetical protein
MCDWTLFFFFSRTSKSIDKSLGEPVWLSARSSTYRRSGQAFETHLDDMRKAWKMASLKQRYTVLLFPV